MDNLKNNLVYIKNNMVTKSNIIINILSKGIYLKKLSIITNPDDDIISFIAENNNNTVGLYKYNIKTGIILDCRGELYNLDEIINFLSDNKLEDLVVKKEFSNSGYLKYNFKYLTDEYSKCKNSDNESVEKINELLLKPFKHAGKTLNIKHEEITVKGFNFDNDIITIYFKFPYINDVYKSGLDEVVMQMTPEDVSFIRLFNIREINMESIFLVGLFKQYMIEHEIGESIYVKNKNFLALMIKDNCKFTLDNISLLISGIFLHSKNFKKNPKLPLIKFEYKENPSILVYINNDCHSFIIKNHSIIITSFSRNDNIYCEILNNIFTNIDLVEYFNKLSFYEILKDNMEE